MAADLETRWSVARTLAGLKLLVSSTSELEAERTLLADAVRDVNQVTERLCGVTLRVIDWRRDLVPGVSSDPQQVINAQASDYDIYLGMFGTRFGTPTPRAGSGTEEEFNKAYSRFRADPQCLRLLFYFRAGLTGSVLNVDSEQLRRVQEFRTRLGSEKGVLYCDFSSPEEFLRLCRGHLTQLVADQWAGSSWKPIVGLEPVNAAEVMPLSKGVRAESADDVPTILDLRVEADEAFEAAMAALAAVVQAFKAGAEADVKWKADAEKAMAAGLGPKKAHELANAKAENFAYRARQLRPLTAAFRTATDEFFAKLGQIIERQIAEGISTPEQMRAGIEQLSQADDAARAARDAYLGVAASLASLPEPTRDFRRQKRALTTQIDQLNAAIASWLDRSAGLCDQFESRGSEGA